jgi:hypothetical protein
VLGLGLVEQLQAQEVPAELGSLQHMSPVLEQLLQRLLKAQIDQLH